MLKQRLITALILIPLVVSSILWLPEHYFAIFVGLFVCVGSWEWTKFLCAARSLQVTLLRILFIGVIAVALLLSWFFILKKPEIVELILIVALFWWIWAFVLVIVYPGFAWFHRNLLFKSTAGAMVLVPTWIAQVSLRNDHIGGIELLLYLLVLIASADTGAYFGGRKWGKNKLAPRVSPGKTWEGVFSGLLCVSVVAIVYSYSLGLHLLGWNNLLVFVLISVMTAIFSIVGDLTESLFKRDAGLKDSGSILPGHGGVLDRVDSLTAAAPVFLLLLGWFYF